MVSSLQKICNDIIGYDLDQNNCQCDYNEDIICEHCQVFLSKVSILADTIDIKKPIKVAHNAISCYYTFFINFTQDSYNMNANKHEYLMYTFYKICELPQTVINRMYGVGFYFEFDKKRFDNTRILSKKYLTKLCEHNILSPQLIHEELSLCTMDSELLLLSLKCGSRIDHNQLNHKIKFTQEHLDLACEKVPKHDDFIMHMISNGMLLSDDNVDRLAIYNPKLIMSCIINHRHPLPNNIWRKFVNRMSPDLADHIESLGYVVTIDDIKDTLENGRLFNYVSNKHPILPEYLYGIAIDNDLIPPYDFENITPTQKQLHKMFQHHTPAPSKIIIYMNKHKLQIDSYCISICNKEYAIRKLINDHIKLNESALNKLLSFSTFGRHIKKYYEDQINVLKKKLEDNRL